MCDRADIDNWIKLIFITINKEIFDENKKFELAEIK